MKDLRKRVTPRAPKNKPFKKAISIICVLALLITMTPASVFGADRSINPDTISNTAYNLDLDTSTQDLSVLSENKADKPYIIGESEDLRDQMTKTFVNSDSSYTVMQYSLPIHFQGADNTWLDFDNSLVSTARGLEPASSPFDFVLPKDLRDNSGVRLNNGHIITWGTVTNFVCET